MIYPDALNKMTRDELLAYGKSINAEVHHKMKDETLKVAILEKQVKAETVQKPVVEKPKAVSEFYTPDELMEAVQPRIEQGLIFRVIDNGESWYAKHGNREDTGTMFMPKDILKRQIDKVMSPSKRATLVDGVLIS
jgi:hypothetical protein